MRSTLRAVPATVPDPFLNYASKLGKSMDEPIAIDLLRVANELGLTREQVENVTTLFDDGNTVPFITRYRKEKTGNLNEELIRQIFQRVNGLRQLAERARTIIRLIDTQNKLTPQLRAEIERADSLRRLEDLYLPYRPKRKSRAEQARQRGLQPLANRIWDGDAVLSDLEAEAAAFVDPEKELPDTDKVLQGVADILAERISEDADVRQLVRKIAWRTGRLNVSATKEGKQSGGDFQNYFNHTEAVSRIPPHRTMAINRGEKAGSLRVRFEWDDCQTSAALAKHLRLVDPRK